MEWTWEKIAEHCKVSSERFVIISDNNDPWNTFITVGRILERLDINQGTRHRCGCWIWLEFDNILDATAFKLAWEEK